MTLLVGGSINEKELKCVNEKGEDITADLLGDYGYTFNRYGVYFLTEEEYEFWDETIARLNYVFKYMSVIGANDINIMTCKVRYYGNERPLELADWLYEDLKSREDPFNFKELILEEHSFYGIVNTYGGSSDGCIYELNSMGCFTLFSAV